MTKNDTIKFIFVKQIYIYDERSREWTYEEKWIKAKANSFNYGGSAYDPYVFGCGVRN